jgi:hypothetical protein
MPGAVIVRSATRTRDGRALKLHRGATFGEVSLAPLQPQSLTNPPLAGSGTGFAINYLTSGVAALSAVSDGAERMQPTRPKRGALLPQSAGAIKHNGRGGARNRADRESHEPTAAQIANLRAAERHAGQIGLPFTRMISIHWQAAGLPLEGMAKATGRFTDLLTKTLARHGSRTAWLWVHENAPGQDKGGHCHLLVHVPADLVPMMTGLQRGWLRRITGQPYRSGVIYSEPIGGRLGLEIGNPELHAVNMAVAFGYVCKGAPQAVLDAFGIVRAHQPGGRIIGKRCGTSQNIGPKARGTWRTQ